MYNGMLSAMKKKEGNATVYTARGSQITQKGKGEGCDRTDVWNLQKQTRGSSGRVAASGGAEASQKE